jgi:hypothetical protein
MNTITFNFRNTFKAAVILLAISAGFITCAEEEDYLIGDARPSVSAYTANTKVMFINASPGSKSPQAASPVIRAVVNNKDTVKNSAKGPVTLLNYLQNTSGPLYRDVFSTSATLVRVENVSDQNKLLVGSSVSITGTANSYSIYLIDSLKRPGGGRLITVRDNLAAPATGKANIRFLHFSPNAPEVKVVNLADTTELFSPRRYAETSRRISGTTVNFNDFITVDARTYNLDVQLASNSQSVLSLNGIVLASGKIYTVYARGFVGGAAGQELGATIIQHN